MLHKFTRYDIDGRALDVWINSRYVVSVSPSGKERTLIAADTGHWIVAGVAAEVVERLS